MVRLILTITAGALWVSCGTRELVLDLPPIDLREVAAREEFEAGPYLERVRVVRGDIRMNEEGKILMAELVFDAYYYPSKTSAGARVRGDSDIVRLVQANFPPEDQPLEAVKGTVAVSDLVDRVLPYVRNPGRLRLDAD